MVVLYEVFEEIIECASFYRLSVWWIRWTAQGGQLSITQVRFTLTLIGKLRGAIQGQATGFIFSMTCSLKLFWFNRPLWGLIVCSEWYRAVNVHFKNVTPWLCCRHSTPKRRMLLWTICTKLPGVEGKHTHKITCFYLWRDYSFRKLFPSKPISLSIEKMWCRVKKIDFCQLLWIEPGWDRPWRARSFQPPGGQKSVGRM